MEEKYIVSTTRAGLGNRIKALVSAIRLGRKLSRKALLYWEKNEYCGCEFKDLFENGIELIDKQKLREIEDGSSHKYDEYSSIDYCYKYDYIILYTWKFLILPEEGEEIDFKYNGVSEDQKQEIISILKELIPVTGIRESVEKFSNRYKLGETVGVHIRRGDTRFSVEGKAQISSENKFIKRMKEFPEDTKFFLSTDSEETEQRVQKEFFGRVIVYPKLTRERHEETALQEALIDMLLLSKTKHLLGSYLSTFTELAWWFGECKAPVEIIGMENISGYVKPKSKILTKIKYYKALVLRKLFGGYK